MDPDSLDWIWEDIDLPRPTEAVDEFNDVAFDGFQDDDDDDDDDSRSDSSCGSSFCCSPLVGDDNRTARELDGIVDDVKERYGRGDLDDVAVSELADDRKSGAEHGTAEASGGSADDASLYADALEAVENKLSTVRLVWADALYRCTVNGENVPDSYVKTTSMEKLVLLYADNFIKQFQAKFPNRRQLMLVHENECGTQKCVCTTIKPSQLVYQDLIDLSGYSQFVANFISYTKLQDPVTMPKYLNSPTTTLQVQTANCFELAILLESFLVGCGYNAFVVQGYASESACNHDLTKVKLDLPKSKVEETPASDGKEEIDDYYAVEPMVDCMRSDYVTLLMEEEKNKNVVQHDAKERDQKDCSDSLYGKRVHCWVAILPLKNENEFESPYFIEPSTGERKDVSDENYIGIEAIWNHKNYWVNLQRLDSGCAQYDFSLMNTERWEQFLSDEPRNLREPPPDWKTTENEAYNHLFMPNSWVNVLNVPRSEYLMVYPSGKKIVLYLNAVKEFYADYVLPDGLVERTTFYTGPDYANKTFVEETYKHRVDKLNAIETQYTDSKTETVEYFSSGRKDCLKIHKFCGNSNAIKSKRSITFYDIRLDSLIGLKIDENSFVAEFQDREDLLFMRMCLFNQLEEENTEKNSKINKRKPMVIIEKYLRDESKHKDRDIATREFNFVTNTIFVQHQYGEDQITQSSRQFVKPSFGSDEFDPESVIENIVYPYEGHLKPYEAYIMLQQMLEAENQALCDVLELENNVVTMLATRSLERSKFKLKIDSLDWDRNYKIRKLLREKKEKKIALAKRDKEKQIDYALPYFGMHKKPFTRETALMGREQILKEFIQRTKAQFIKMQKLFNNKQLKLQYVAKAIENDVFKNLEQKNKMLMSCSLLKSELNVLVAKMNRIKEKHGDRYNNLVSYLNTNLDLK